MLFRIICLRLLFIFICFSFSQKTYAQHRISFENDGLKNIFLQIERYTDWTFNYDPKEISGYTFTGRVDLTKPDIFVKKLLRNTPFEFEIVRESILIILPEMKEYYLCGYLKGEGHKNALPFGTLHLEGTKKGTSTDTEGHFEFKIKAHKNQRIIFNYVGYSPKKYKLDDWKSGDCKNVSLKLTPQTLGVNITVKDQIIRSVSQGVNKTQLDYDRLRKKNTYEEYDVLKTVQHLPGITSIDETATNLSIRGSTPDQNLILWEGVRLYDSGHFFGMISAVNPFVINKVDVYKDSYAPHFGNAIGGVVDMSLGNKQGKPIRGGIGSNFTEAHAHISTPMMKNRLSLMASGRHSINELFNTPTINNYVEKVFEYSLTDRTGNKEEEIGEMGADNEFNFYDFNAKAVGRINDNMWLQSSYFQSHNDVLSNTLFERENIGVEEAMLFNSKALSTRLNIRLRSRLDWRSEWYHTWSSYQNIHSFEYRDEEEDEGFSDFESLNNGITDHQLGMLTKLKIRNKTSIHFGYNYENKTVNYEFSESFSYEDEYNEEEYLQGNFHNIIGSIFYEKDAFQFEAHTRNTYYNELNKLFFSPRITMQYKLRPNVKLRFSTGRFYQFISQIEDFRENGPTMTSRLWILHNDIADKVLRSDKIAMGGTWTVRKWMLDAEAYWRDNSGILGIPVIFNSEEFESTGTSQAVGLDILLYKDWKYYGVWANYSLAKHTMLFPDIQEDRFSASNDHRHSLNLNGSVNFNKWQGTLTWKYRSGLPFSEPLDIYSYEVEEEEDELETLYAFEYDQLNKQRQKAYHRIDAALSYKTTFSKKKINLEARLALINILDIENASTPNYYLAESEDEDEDETPRQFSIERNLLGRTPQFLLRFYW